MQKINKEGAATGCIEPCEALELKWRVSPHICALTDGERHVGHIVRIGGRWHAFDAMHSNDAGDGFRPLGIFAGLQSAQKTVEQAYRVLPLPFAGAA